VAPATATATQAQTVNAKGTNLDGYSYSGAAEKYPFGVNRLAKFRVSRESALLRVDLRVH